MVFLSIQKTFSYNFHLCIHHALFYMSLNDEIVDIQKPDGICSPAFVLDGFSGLSSWHHWGS